MSFLLDATSRFGEEGGYMTIGEVFANGGKYFLLGILTVFAVLGIIWAFLEIFHRACGIAQKKTIVEIPETKAEATPAPVATQTPVVTSVPETDDAEIIAVIAAAIEAAKAETPNGQFRVVSFRKK